MQHLPLARPTDSNCRSVRDALQTRIQVDEHCTAEPATRQSVSTASLAEQGLGRVEEQPRLKLLAHAIDALHIDQGRTAGFKHASNGLQPSSEINRAANQQGWIWILRAR